MCSVGFSSMRPPPWVPFGARGALRERLFHRVLSWCALMFLQHALRRLHGDSKWLPSDTEGFPSSTKGLPRNFPKAFWSIPGNPHASLFLELGFIAQLLTQIFEKKIALPRPAASPAAQGPGRPIAPVQSATKSLAQFATSAAQFAKSDRKFGRRSKTRGKS